VNLINHKEAELCISVRVGHPSRAEITILPKQAETPRQQCVTLCVVSLVQPHHASADDDDVNGAATAVVERDIQKIHKLKQEMEEQGVPTYLLLLQVGRPSFPTIVVPLLQRMPRYRTLLSPRPGARRTPPSPRTNTPAHCGTSTSRCPSTTDTINST
jgi:hypothetical protein